MRIYEADIVSAFRFDRTGEGARRAVYSYVYNHLVRTVLGVRVRDVNFACKLVRRRVLDHVELRSEGSFIDVELLARAQRLGFHTVQFGVDYFPRTRGISTLSSNAVIVQIVREMLALHRELALDRAPARARRCGPAPPTAKVRPAPWHPTDAPDAAPADRQRRRLRPDPGRVAAPSSTPTATAS